MLKLRIPLIIVLFILDIACYLNAQTNDLILQDTVFTTTSSYTAKNSIIVGPNVMIESSGNISLEAGEFIVFKPLLTIQSGGIFQAGTGKITNVNEQFSIIPDEIYLYQNYPNPFNVSTKIHYSIPQKTHVSVRIYNLLGIPIKVLTSKIHEPGHYTLEWDSTDYMGKIVSSGIYYIKLDARDYSYVNKMLLMK